MKLWQLYSFELKPKDPFNFHLTASCYNFKWWSDGSQCLTPISRDPPMIASAHYLNGKVRVNVYGKENEDHVNVEGLIRHVLGLNEDLTSFYDLIKDDAILREVSRSLRDMRMRATNL